MSSGARVAPLSRGKVCVIGAGGSGLPAIHWAKLYGFEVTCFEVSDGVGGLWHYKPNPTELGTVMRGTVINTSKEMLAYSDYPPDRNLPNFMHHSALHRYMEDYCCHFDLWPCIRLRHRVSSVHRAGDYADTGNWIVSCVDEEKGEFKQEVFNAVVVASGHHARPFYPTKFDGQDTFTGRISHAHDYRSPSGYDEKTVVVVGVGNSGADVASELARFTRQVYLVSRRGGTWVFNRMQDHGVPYDYNLANRFANNVMAKIVPAKTFCKAVEDTLNRRFDHERFGIKPPHSPLATHPTVCDELPLRLMAGTVIMKPQIKSFSRGMVIFEDGTCAVDVDEVIFCTGYSYDLNIVEEGKAIPVVNNRHPGMFLHMFPPQLADKNTLCFVGLLMPWGGLFPVAEMQSRLFFAQLARECKLPSATKMCKYIMKDKAAAAARFVNSDRHNFEVDFVPYMERLAGIIKCRPPNLKLFLADFKLFKEVFFGPCVSYVYRLNGQHKWDGAKKAILEVEERTAAAYEGKGPIGSHNGYSKLGLDAI